MVEQKPENLKNEVLYANGETEVYLNGELVETIPFKRKEENPLRFVARPNTVTVSEVEAQGVGSQKTTDWIETYTNKRFYPLEPDLHLICIEDIAHSLSHICRFNGHSKRFYSVGEHSLGCLGLARRMGLSYTDRLAALMHDAAEAYLADIPRPIKRSLHAYGAWEIKLESMIFARFRIPYPFSPVVYKLDEIMLATERRDLFISPHHWPSLKADPSYDINVESGPDPATVKDNFINEFVSLMKVLGNGAYIK